MRRGFAACDTELSFSMREERGLGLSRWAHGRDTRLCPSMSPMTEQYPNRMDSDGTVQPGIVRLDDACRQHPMCSMAYGSRAMPCCPLKAV